MTDLAAGATRFVGGPSDGHVVHFAGGPPESITYDDAEGVEVRYVYNPQTLNMEVTS